jgi:hypothetical protein
VRRITLKDRELQMIADALSDRIDALHSDKIQSYGLAPNIVSAVESLIDDYKELRHKVLHKPGGKR